MAEVPLIAQTHGVSRGAQKQAEGQPEGGGEAALPPSPLPAQNLMNFFRLYVEKMVSGTMIKRSMYMEVCACENTF